MGSCKSIYDEPNLVYIGALPKDTKVYLFILLLSSPFQNNLTEMSLDEIYGFLMSCTRTGKISTVCKKGSPSNFG